MDYFFEHWGQALSLVGVAAVWLAFTAIGAFLGGAERDRAYDPIIGWAAVSFLFTAAGVATSIPFTHLGGLAAAAAVAAGVAVWRRDGALVSPQLLRILAMTLPLLVLVSAMRGSQWDEFSDWLIIPRYLLETDTFPSKENPFPKAVYTGYPYSWHFVTYLASRVAGYLLENAGALFNVLLLLNFALVVVRLIARGLEREDLADKPGWRLLAFAALTTTLINPTFAQKVVLTSYADTPSAVAAGMAVVLAWFLIEDLVAGRSSGVRRNAWQLGLVLLLLINLKQATMVLVTLTVLAAAFVMIRDPQVPLGKVVRLLPAIIGPPVIIYLVWRYHVSSDLAVREFSVRSFDGWFIHLIPQILWNMLVALSKKGYYLALIVIAVIFGVRGFFRSRTPFDRFAAIAAMVVLGYNAFLLFAYVTTFGEFDALRVASYWRYNMHLGAVIVAFSAYGAAVLWRRGFPGQSYMARVSWLPVALLIAAPFVFAPKLRFDKAPMVVHYRAVGSDVAHLVRKDDGVYVVDPGGSGESGVIASYEIGERATWSGYVTAFFPNRLEALAKNAKRPGVTVLVVHSLVEGYEDVLGLTLAADRSHMLRKTGPGQWTIVQSWPKPSSN